jgi:Spy/CpxP family protein refolding chaperone
MRNICTIAFGIMLLLGIGVTAAEVQDSTQQDNSTQTRPFGPGGHHRPMDVDSELAHLTKELDLTPEQQNQIRPLLVEHQQKEQVLHQDQSLSPDELRIKAHAISDETHKQIEVFLTDEQKQKVKAMQQRMHHGDQNDQPSPPASPSQTSFGWDPAADVAR